MNYDDSNCEGCQENLETREEITKCEKLGKNESHAEYSLF